MILALAPHTDDAVLGAGGYIAKLAEEEEEIAVLAFGTGNAKNGSRESEFFTAMRTLGVETADILGFYAHHYPVIRQRILEKIETYIQLVQPDMLIIPGKHDHQDHQVVRKEAIRAARRSSLNVIAYSQSWAQSMCGFTPRFFVALEFRHLSTKMRALEAFISQQFRPYMEKDATIATAKHYGMAIGVDFAEAFEVVRWTI